MAKALPSSFALKRTSTENCNDGQSWNNKMAEEREGGIALTLSMEGRWRRVCLHLILLHQMKLTQRGGVGLGVVMTGNKFEDLSSFFI